MPLSSETEVYDFTFPRYQWVFWTLHHPDNIFFDFGFASVPLKCGPN